MVETSRISTGTGTGTGAGADESLSHGRKRKATAEEAPAMLDYDDDDHLEDDEDVVDDEMETEEEGVTQVKPLEGLKHADESIYKKINVYTSHFRLGSSEETSLQPMRLTLPTTEECKQQPTCSRHVGSPMLQIFSVKLTKLPAVAGFVAAATTAAGLIQIQLYGFMAVRDLKDPLRNYIFNRSREDPLVIEDLRWDPFVYLSGPKRGVHMQGWALFEYDLRIKREYEHEPVMTSRIRGYRGAAVDVRRARLLRSMEATVEVWIHQLHNDDDDDDNGGGGMELSISAGFADVPATTMAEEDDGDRDDDNDDEIKLFCGVIQKPCALNRFMVAVNVGSFLVLQFRVPGSSWCERDRIGKFAFKCTAHGSTSDCRKFDFATVEVKVTWSPMH